MNVTSGTQSSSLKESKGQSNNLLVPNSLPFVSNISANYSSSICNPFYTATTVSSEPGKLFSEMLTMPTASNTVNKMDVEDPFIISDSIGIVSSQQGKIESTLIKHAPEGRS